ncbi:MAG TPA: ABC transporter ATP-binding protein [Pseudomonadales bacterium]|nr:ABC transporter ATP-binding protein [Pseudomonadales bacterium]
MNALLRIENLCKYFSQHGETVLALDNISLSIQPGEIVGLAGESGSGKSTLARCVAGLHSRDSGEMYFNDALLPARFRAQDFARQAQNIQMIFQDPLSSLNPRLTIGDILMEPLRLSARAKQIRLSPQQQQSLAQEWLIRMGLRASDMSRYPHSFSGGQLQRIGIARALINRPGLLICDEPISALDVSVQAQIVNLLKDLRDEFGLALLFIGHDLAMMRYLCDRIAVMYRGAIVEQGATQDILDHPQHGYTKKLVNSTPGIH